MDYDGKDNKGQTDKEFKDVIRCFYNGSVLLHLLLHSMMMIERNNTEQKAKKSSRFTVSYAFFRAGSLHHMHNFSYRVPDSFMDLI